MKKSKKLKELKEKLEKTEKEKQELIDKKNTYKAILAFIGIIVFFIAFYYFVIWMKDIAVPTAYHKFQSWYDASDFNRGYFSGSLFVAAIVFVGWFFKKMFIGEFYDFY